MTEQGLSPEAPEDRFAGRHVCMIFDSDEQRRGVVADYLASGLRLGDRVRYFADVAPPETIRGWLEGRGIDAAPEEARGAFAIVPAVDAYCAGGRHVPEEVIAAVMRGYGVAERGGFTGSRVCAEMSWALRGLEGSERLLEYESMLNQIDVPFRHSGMCQYDARRFDGATLFKVLQVHPFMVAQGQIVQNPAYVRPDELLRPGGK